MDTEIESVGGWHAPQLVLEHVILLLQQLLMLLGSRPSSQHGYLLRVVSINISGGGSKAERRVSTGRGRIY